MKLLLPIWKALCASVDNKESEHIGKMVDVKAVRILYVCTSISKNTSGLLHVVEMVENVFSSKLKMPIRSFRRG